jgi:hypothetical protein
LGGIGIGENASRAGVEGVGLAIQESLARGKPVVRVERVVAAEIKDAAVKFVAAAAGHDIND